jgi:hypothetical protein
MPLSHQKGHSANNCASRDEYRSFRFLSPARDFGRREPFGDHFPPRPHFHEQPRSFVRTFGGHISFPSKFTMSSDAASTDAASSAGKKRELPLFYQSVHERNINLVRKLVEAVLPVAYNDDFYKNMATVPNDFTKMGE